jgi:hypothetical protein
VEAILRGSTNPKSYIETIGVSGDTRWICWKRSLSNSQSRVGAFPAVVEGGIIIIAANNRDREPIGSSEYKTLLHLSKIQGPDGYLELLRSPYWRFTKDQWEPEVWER